VQVCTPPQPGPGLSVGAPARPPFALRLHACPHRRQQPSALPLPASPPPPSAFSASSLQPWPLQPPALASSPAASARPGALGSLGTRITDQPQPQRVLAVAAQRPAPLAPAGCWRIHIRSPQLLLRTPNATGRGSPLEGAWLFSKTAHFASDSPDIQLGPGPVSPTAHCMPLPLATTTVQMTKRPSSSSCLKQLLRMRIPQMLQMCSLITGERLRGGWRECCRWCDGTVRTKESDSWERLCASPPTAPQCWVLAVPVAVCWGGGGREHCRRCCRCHHDITKEGR
jgi:hypothetical protein